MGHVYSSNTGYCIFSKCMDSIWITIGSFGNYNGGFYESYSDPEIVPVGDTLFAIMEIDWSAPRWEGTYLRVFRYFDGYWHYDNVPIVYLARFTYTRSLAVFQGMPVVAIYSDDPNYNLLRILRLEESTWRDIGYPSGGNLNELNDHFTVEADNSSIYIAGLDLTGTILVKQLYDSSSVDIGSPGNSGERIKSVDLKLINGQLFVSFSDRDNGFRTTVKKYDGSNWNYVGLPGFSDGPGTDIHLSNDGSIPYVAFNDSVNSGITVMRFNGIQWLPEGQPGFKKLNWGSSGRQNITVPDGNAYVALTLNDTDYCSGSNSSYVTTMGYGNNVLPVNLSSFYTIQRSGIVDLFWTTSLETNNEGFYVERKLSGSEWKSLEFVKGAGNSAVPTDYHYIDRIENPGVYNYRLRQIDFNGNFSYFDLEGTVTVGLPEELILFQNSPNPFNPETNISFGKPMSGFVRLRVYDVSGREVKTLIDDFLEAGYFKIRFDGSGYSSGTYFIRLETENKTLTKRMVLVK
ncbi:MAG: T9SS type A sorting domain-containing protein [Ignavibacteria bacterium]|nr:T9SS type A sorting domain-containing protein [Ignavibacteria bacterium]